MPSGEHGFTLIEAMVVIAIIAILAAVAGPDMVQFMRARQLESVARKIGTAAQFARSEAIKRNSPILLCAGTAGVCRAAPDTGHWTAGWLICYDRDADGACDTGTASDPNPIRMEAAQSAASLSPGPPTGSSSMPTAP